MHLRIRRHNYTSTWEKINHYIFGAFAWAIVGNILWIGLYFTKDFDDVALMGLLIFGGILVIYTTTRYWVAIGIVAHSLFNLILLLTDTIILNGISSFHFYCLLAPLIQPLPASLLYLTC